MNEYWALVAQVGLWGWVFSILFLIKNTFPARELFVKAAACKWGGISLLFFTTWIIGMLSA